MRGRPQVIAALLVALALVALLIPALGSGALSRDRVIALLEKQLEQRGLEVESISRCFAKTRRGNRIWVCNWYAKGRDEGGVPYDCRGRAVYSVGTKKWRIDRCDSILEPQIPLTPNPGPHPAFGYSGTNFSGVGQQWFDLLDRSASNVLRQGLIWETVERRQGHFDWSRFDELYQRLLGLGVRPLWILTIAPCWAQEEDSGCNGRTGNPGNFHPTPAHYDEFARFAAMAAERYPQSAGIEVWNEANYDKFWGGNADAETYAQMLKKIAPAIHRANPNMPVFSTGMSPHHQTVPQAIGYPQFLETLYRKGAAQLTDGIAIHPYPSVPYSQNPQTGGYVERIRVHMERVDKVMRKHNDGDTPIIVTEVGVSTAGNDSYTRDEQAKALVDIYDLFRHIDGVPMVIVHRFADDPNASDDEGGFGVVTADGTAKPALCALADARGEPCG